MEDNWDIDETKRHNSLLKMHIGYVEGELPLFLMVDANKIVDSQKVNLGKGYLSITRSLWIEVNTY